MGFRIMEGRESRRYLIEGRFVSVNNHNAAIVAVVTVPPEPLPEGHLGWRGDWAAYWGGYLGDASEEATLQWVARYGAKMSENDARHYFFGDNSLERQRFGNLPYRP